MTGLSESFDVVKRLALLQFIGSSLSAKTSFKMVFDKYNRLMPEFSISLSRYRDNCSRDARKKFQTGLVRHGAATSFSKYVRIGGELGLYDFEYDSKSPHQGVLIPNKITPLLRIISQLVPSQHAKTSFELGFISKVFFLQRIISMDSSLFIPLIYSLSMTDERIESRSAKSQITSAYLKSLVEYHSGVLRAGIVNSSSGPAMLRRLEAFRNDLENIQRGKKLRKTVGHILDARLHWLYDLKLVDYPTFCNHDEVIPAGFWNLHESKGVVDFVLSVVNHIESLLFSYGSYLTKVGDDRRDLGDLCLSPISIAERTALEMAKHYPGYIPLSSILELALVYSVNCNLRTTKHDVLQDVFSLGYQTYRFIDGSDTYIDVK